MDELDVTQLTEERPAASAEAGLKAIIEAIVYVTDEPLSAQQIAAALERPIDVVQRLLTELSTEYAGPGHGLTIREVAGGYKMATKAEHHEAVRAFVKKLTPPLRLSLAALETLAVVAYKQPVTAPEILEIRGVQGAGVLKTLLDRKLIAEAGRKKVVGQPILYKTTKEFLIQFGLKDLRELPTLKEFEEIGRMAIAEDEPQAALPLEDAAAEGASEAGAEAATEDEKNDETSATSEAGAASTKESGSPENA
jgi:segregation and condensation protein B